MRAAYLVLCAALCGMTAASPTTTAPTGLLVDFQKNPALGVRTSMQRFSWIVAPCQTGSDHEQTSYQLKISMDGQMVWDSGVVSSTDSTYAPGPASGLEPGTRYQWTVTTWTKSVSSPSNGSCQSAASAPGVFVTALTQWSNGSKFIGLKTSKPIFGYFRKEVSLPPGIVSAVMFITTSAVQTPLLSAYKVYVDGELINLGPGRGEAPVWDGDGKFRSLPYTTLDLTPTLMSGGKRVLALQVMNSNGGPTPLLQLNIRTKSGANIVISTDETWMGFDADTHRKPGPPQHGHSSGTGFLEYIDARGEPVGWQRSGFTPSGWSAVTATAISTPGQLHAKMEPPMQVEYVSVKTLTPLTPSPAPPPANQPATCGDWKENAKATLGCAGGGTIDKITFASFGTPTGTCSNGFKEDSSCHSNHSMAVLTSACLGKTQCELAATCSQFHEALKGKGAFCYDIKKSLAATVTCKGGHPPTPKPAPSPNSINTFLADFGRELQGGLILSVGDGHAGQTVHIACGESLKGQTVGTTWGWEFDWTLREGAQVLSQHKFMECRFVSLVFSGDAPKNFTLSAWKTHYPWDPMDTHFSSSNDTLDSVWELARYTLEAASLDTYTDSNTRERRPYEADGIIAATARLMVQRDVLWPRHSHAWVLAKPTWPVEWKQISPFLGWQDYQATGQPDLSLAFMSQMHERTMIGFLESSTGLLDTSKMGRHIVDWMPDGGERDETVARGEFTASNHMSVSNMFGAHGLELLSTMVGVGGRTENATAFAQEAASLKKNIVAKMWNGTAFCDGVCSEVGGHSLLMTNMFSLCFGMMPAAHVSGAWHTVADWGLEQIGDYGAFWYQTALASGYYAPYYDTPDDGTAMLTALTKCDQYSWCSGLRDDNLTMTRESWHDGTYSHQWGTSPIVGVVQGLMGVHQTSPGFATFTVKPKLGGLTHATILVPTLRGHINVTAGPGSVHVHIPCNTRATVCMPRSALDSSVWSPERVRLLVDGVEVAAVASGGHLCAASPIGCGPGGAPRSLTTHPRV